MATIAQPAGRAYERPVILEWLTTVDHKKIGLMYLYFTFTMFFVAGCLALVFRTQLAEANNTLITHDTFNELVSIHGSTMVWLFGIPMWAGFGNFLVPLQIGARDMAFPRINALALWMIPAGVFLMYSGFLMHGGAEAAGWTAYSPLAVQEGPGLDVWILGVIVVGISSTIGAANFLVTATRMRAPGMSMFRVPVFVWAMIITSLLQLLATPVLASDLAMLFIDHNFGAKFFDPTGGGNVLLWQNIFWFYSHPAVYIMILPGFGMISEIIPVFSRKPLFGYKSMVFAIIAIGGLAFAVWAHHMFTTGGVLLPWFAFMTFMIGVPTGVKFFNWIATMWKGAITYETPMLYSLGFLVTFLIGGINGIVSAVVPVDFAIHDTYFIVSHIHYVLFGGAVFSAFAGLYFWFPKFFGRRLDERLGKIQFWIMFIAMNITFFPMMLLGLDGMPRRIATYAGSTGWGPLNFVETISAYFIGIGLFVGLINVFWTLTKPKDQPADPWHANSLEWWAASPPAPHNFDTIPPITSLRPVWDERQAGRTPESVAAATAASS